MEFVFGGLFGIFTPHLLEPVSRWIGTAWHVATRRRTLDEHDPITYVIHKAMVIERVRKFFRIQSPHPK